MKPAYPDLARQMRLSGKVKLDLAVSAEGRVVSVKPLGGHPVLIAAAVEAARQWIFEPASKESNETLTFEFIVPE